MRMNQAHQAPKRALLYTRVSTDEQADRGYSLRDQEARLRQYCQRESIEVVGHFQDDASAKTFLRPAWQEMMASLEADPAAADALLVVKWDRFSRDATGALSMIRHLEALGVAVQATEQPIDHSVPEQLMMLAIYVAAPEVENRRRSIATKQGMRRAMREGRYVNVPPKGYQRGHDEEGRYLIVPSGDADYVREAFRLAASTLLSMDEIRRRLMREGFRCSKNQFTLLLRNPLYAGRIVIPAWRGEPADVAEGRHEPLVDEATFERVQERFEKKRTVRRRLVDELPLRRHLLDPESGERLTGSRSRSRHGYYVWYYHGRGRGAFRLSASKAHDAFEAHLGRVELAPEVVALYRQIARQIKTEGAAQKAQRLRRARERMAEIEARLLQVDERFLDGDLERDSYARLKGKYRRELSQVRSRLAEEGRDRAGQAARLDFAAGVMGRLTQVWDQASAEARDLLVGSIWPAGLEITGGVCRTPVESEVIALFRGKTQKMKDADPSKEDGVLLGSPGRRCLSFLPVP